ncbi:MAG: hypothetical protein VCB81_02200, partial [Verrucomicrobiia bacterium]
MKHTLLSLLTLSLCLPLMAREKPKPATVDYSANWHQWRGPLGNGMAPEGNPPVRWSETNNLKWKVAIPGSGSATPIVWGNQIFVVSAIKTDRKPKKIVGQDQPGRRRFGGRMSTPTPTT